MQRIARHNTQKQGGSFMVTLPAIWVKDMGISQFDIIDIYREGSSLILKKANENGGENVKRQK